jgi:hypothetical protein
LGPLKLTSSVLCKRSGVSLYVAPLRIRRARKKAPPPCSSMKGHLGVCAITGIMARLKLGTIDGCARSLSWQSPRVCRATFRNRPVAQRRKQVGKLKGPAGRSGGASDHAPSAEGKGQRQPTLPRPLPIGCHSLSMQRERLGSQLGKEKPRHPKSRWWRGRDEERRPPV